MNRKQKKVLIRIIIASILMIGLSVLTGLVPMNQWAEALLFMIPYLVIGYDILRKAGKGILNRQVFDEKFSDGDCNYRCDCSG